MDGPKVAFDEVPWEILAPGSRHKLVVRDGRRLRLLELDERFVEPDWCTRGHFGVVVSGTLRLDTPEGEAILQPGDALALPAGARHKASVAQGRAVLFLVEDA